MTYTIKIRPKRQITLPKAVIDGLGSKVGDTLTLKLQKKQATLTPNKQIALDALKELQRLFKESGIPEKEFQDAVIRSRHQNANNTT